MRWKTVRTYGKILATPLVYSSDSLDFELGLIDSGLGLMILNEMSPRTH